MYDNFYIQRGADSKHRIKELKLGIQADRLSYHRFEANQLRLLLAQAAYILLLTIRHAATGTQFATAQVERLRSRPTSNQIHVIRTDAMIGIQALERLHPDQRMKLGDPRRLEYEYEQQGTLSLIVNWQMALGEVTTPSLGPACKELTLPIMWLIRSKWLLRMNGIFC